MKYTYVPTCWDTKFNFTFVYRDPSLKGHLRITGTSTVLRKWVKASWPWHCRFCHTVWSSLCSWGSHTRVYLRDNLLIVLFDRSKAQTQRPSQHLRASQHLKLPSTSTLHTLIWNPAQNWNIKGSFYFFTGEDSSALIHPWRPFFSWKFSFIPLYEPWD